MVVGVNFGYLLAGRKGYDDMSIYQMNFAKMSDAELIKMENELYELIHTLGVYSTRDVLLYDEVQRELTLREGK